MATNQSAAGEGMDSLVGSSSQGGTQGSDTSLYDMQRLKAAPKVDVVGEKIEKTSSGEVTVLGLKYDCPGAGGETLTIFAHYAYPTAKRNTKLPAIVWVHGGACIGVRQAVVEWASRGYAALSMDLPGKGGEVRAGSQSTGPDMSDENIFRVTPSPRNSYLYLCVNAVCRAISLLANRREVDARRIGVLGYSWGGVITLLANGVDDRVAAACSVYGAGFIPDESIWVNGQLKGVSAQDAKVWRKHFDPSSYLGTQHGRTLFASATGDIYYPLRSFLRTHNGAQCEKSMCLAPNRNHELDDGCTESVVRWFDWALRSGPGLPKLTVTRSGDTLKVTARGGRPVVSVSLVTADGTDFTKAKWKGTEMAGKGGSWTCKAPTAGTPYYVTGRDDGGATVTAGVQTGQ